jgi:hypothetical protein
MRAAAGRPGTPTAFLWGINGAASVCASVFGVVIAVFFGITAAFWTGAAVYAVATLAIWAISRAQERRGVVVEHEPVTVEEVSPATLV